MKNQIFCDGKPCLFPQMHRLEFLVTKIIVTPKTSSDVLTYMLASVNSNPVISQSKR